MFDADTFKSSTVTGENDTVFTPIPEGEYQALAGKVDVRQAKSSIILDITWEIDDAAVEAVTGRDKNSARQSIFLDITESGGLDMSKGKNVQLGKLREALGQNGPGAWSPSMIEGNVARVKIAHRLYESQIFSDVKGVSAI